jgi:uncharacterized protein
VNYYVRERLGPKQSLTKEGYLLCEAVPVARTGQMVYGAGEVPLPPGPDGVIYIDRFEADVFRPETLASVNGKDIVNEHPDEDVKPENWRYLSAGVVLNARRGEGADSDIMLADFVVKDPGVMDLIRSGKREVSCGYDADYIQATERDGTPIPGRGKQVNILMNHVALVEAGRCGPRCAIGDSKPKELNMSWIDKVKAAFGAKDEAALNAALAEAPKGETISLTTDQLRALNSLTTAHVRDCKCKDCARDGGVTKDAVVDAVFADKRFTDVADNVKRIADAFEKKDKEDEEEEEEEETKDNEAIEGNLELEAPPGTGDGIAAKAKDSLYLVDSFQESVSLAEIIAPGIAVPTVDNKAEPKKTLDALCAFRKRVLDVAATQPDLLTFMTNTTGGRDYKTFDCGATRALFLAVGNHRRALNNAAASRDRVVNRESGGGDGPVGKIRSIADINKLNADYYKTLQ